MFVGGWRFEVLPMRANIKKLDCGKYRICLYLVDIFVIVMRKAIETIFENTI
jgi:hypothetical protein